MEDSEDIEDIEDWRETAAERVLSVLEGLALGRGAGAWVVRVEVVMADGSRGKAEWWFGDRLLARKAYRRMVLQLYLRRQIVGYLIWMRGGGEDSFLFRDER